MLLEFKSDINAKKSDGATPIFHARRELAEVLIAKGADLTIRNNSGGTPLHSAMDIETADLFIKKGLSIDDIDYSSQTPLHQFVWLGSNMVDLAIKNGANVNAKDKDFRTPMINLAMTEGSSDGFRDEDIINIIK